MIKVSILVAVYNGARFLPVCLDSLCGQTLGDIQIICIDDASTDDTPRILADYAARDPRISVLRLATNQGQAVARNEGLAHANGAFITMVDADDYLAPDALQKAWNALQADPEADSALFSLMLHHDDSHTDTPFPLRTTQQRFTGEEALLEMVDWHIHGYMLVRAEVHKRWPYDTTCRLYSDDNTARLHCLHSRHVILTDGIYYYRQHEQSATHHVSVRHFLHLSAGVALKEALMREAAQGHLQHPDRVLNRLEVHRWSVFIGCYNYYCRHRARFTPAEQQEALGIMRRTLPLIDGNRIPWSFKWKPWFYPFGHFAVFRFFMALRHLLPHGK